MQEQLMQNQWLEWAQKIKAISQIGKTYTKDPYDLERYNQLETLAHEIFAIAGDKNITEVSDFFIPDEGYATPKIDLRGGVIKDKKILLVKERSNKKWTLPGGWADVCESGKEGIEREVFEESGFKVNATKLVTIKDRNKYTYRSHFPHHVYKIFYLCEIISGAPKENVEISDIQFFERTALPELSTERVLPEDSEMIFKYHENKNLPTFFD